MEVDEGCSIRFTFQGYIGWSFLLWCFLLPSPQDVSVMSHGGAQRSNSKFPSLNKWHWWNCAPIAGWFSEETVVLVLVYCQILLWAHSKKGSFLYTYSTYCRWQYFLLRKLCLNWNKEWGYPQLQGRELWKVTCKGKRDIQPIHWICTDWVFSDMLTNGAEVLVAFGLWPLILIIAI